MTSEMRVMGGQGDTKVIWDSANADETAAAKATFDDLIKKRFTAYSVKKNGDKDEKITTFDPKAEKIIMVPQLAGG